MKLLTQLLLLLAAWTSLSPTQAAEIRGNVERVVWYGDAYYLEGWACAADVNQSIDLHLYVGGTWPSGTMVEAARADLPSEPGVSSACGTTLGRHRFRYKLRQQLLKQHYGKSIYTYGILNGTTLGLVPTSGVAMPAQPYNGQVRGNIEGVYPRNGAQSLEGWACAYGINQSVSYHVYAGGPWNQGTFIGGGVANAASESAVGSACGTSLGMHRFKMPLSTDVLNQHQGKALYVYALIDAYEVNEQVPGTPAVPAAPLMQIASFTAEPRTIAVDGASVLKWSTSDATGCSIDQGIGTVPVNGEKTVSPSATTLYTLNCSGNGGPKQASTGVDVVPGVPGKPGADKTPNFGSYTVTWGAAAGTVKHYQLEESPNGSSAWVAASPAPTTPTKTYSGKTAGTYYYRVKACNDSGCGAYSEPGGPVQVTEVRGNVERVVWYGDAYYLEGWACTYGVNQSIDLSFYAGGTWSSGTHMDVVRADLPSEAGVSSACGTTLGRHRFRFRLRQYLLKQHYGKSITTYAVQLPGTILGVVPTAGVSLPAQPYNGQVRGNVEGVYLRYDRQMLEGWACAYGINQAVTYHVYAGGPWDKGTFIGAGFANAVSEPAVGEQCGTTLGMHRFQLPLSAEVLSAHQGKPLYVYALLVAYEVNDQVPGTPSVPSNEALQILSFSAEPSTIASGQSSTLSWQISGATNCSIDQGIGTVATPTDSKVVSPTMNTTYTLSCEGNGGPKSEKTSVSMAVAGAVWSDWLNLGTCSAQGKQVQVRLCPGGGCTGESRQEVACTYTAPPCQIP